VARIGRRSGAIDALLAQLGARRGGFVGAWNPGGRRASADHNRRMMLSLALATRRLKRAQGHGGVGRWQEVHLLLAGDPRRLAVLGRRWRQGGIVLVQVGAKARLVLL